MKYQVEININLPRKRVIELFDSTENMAEWQPGFISFEPISGEPGKEGSKANLKYKMGKREVDMFETITKNNFPNEFDATYESKGVYNIVRNKFIEIEPQKTKWISENEFRFNGYMKIIAFLMPGAFKKQSYKYLKLFKEFAENAN